MPTPSTETLRGLGSWQGGSAPRRGVRSAGGRMGRTSVMRSSFDAAKRAEGVASASLRRHYPDQVVGLTLLPSLSRIDQHPRGLVRVGVFVARVSVSRSTVMVASLAYELRLAHPMQFQAPHSAAMLRRSARNDSVRTLVIALGANLVAGRLSGSTAMLAEAAHSFADSLNEVFLGVSLRRALRPPDAEHPFGHRRERFLWAFMAAIASFLIGGCLSIGLAIREWESGSEME